MKLLGVIDILQVQRDPLKMDLGDREVYQTTNLVPVNRMRVTRRGVFGVLEDGQAVIDAHNSDHPLRGGKFTRRTLSIGFTPYYDRIRARFGMHLVDGCAGENIIVRSSTAFSQADLAGTIVVMRGLEKVEIARLRVTQWLEPCDPFSHYVNQAEDRLPPEQLKATLQFLREGHRGFLLEQLPRADGSSEFFVQVGDELHLEETHSA